MPRFEPLVEGAPAPLADILERGSEHGRHRRMKRRGLDRLRHDRADAGTPPPRVGSDVVLADRRREDDR